MGLLICKWVEVWEIVEGVLGVMWRKAEQKGPLEWGRGYVRAAVQEFTKQRVLQLLQNKVGSCLHSFIRTVFIEHLLSAKFLGMAMSQ